MTTKKLTLDERFDLLIELLEANGITIPDKLR